MIYDNWNLIDPGYTQRFFISAGIIAGLFVFIFFTRPRWKVAGYFILLVLLMRILLFGLPFSWGMYNALLTVDDIGWRQQSAVNVEYYKFFRNTGKKYLAVGSSQTYSLYQEYSKSRHDLIVFNLAGMTPLDFYLYRDYIAAKKPEYILLFLSEFDLAKEPSLDAAKIAPAQGWDLLNKFSIYSEISHLAKTELAFKEMSVGEFFPEYKYAFIFKGLSNKLFKKNESLKVKSLYDQLHPDSNKLQKEISGILSAMDKRCIQYQIYFLKEFLRYCDKQGIKVVIAEGQYNPIAYTETSLRLNEVVHQELSGLVQEFRHVQFIPRAETYLLKEADYDDSVHVNSEVAKRYVDDLLDKIK